MALPQVTRTRSIVPLQLPKSLEENFVVYGFRGSAMPELSASLQRVGHTIVAYSYDLFLFGGYGPKNTYTNEVFRNVKMTLQWKEIQGVGVLPQGRANHTAVVYENKMIVFGGNRNLDVFDDVCILNLDTMRWERITYEKGQGPGPVFSHSAVYVPATHTMLVIGGFHQRHHNMYLAHSFDVRHRTWNGIRGPASVSPRHVQLCTAVYHPASLSLVVVGIVERDVLSTTCRELPLVFMMNVHTCIWTEVTTPMSPESPVPFRMMGLWEYFIRDMITMGSVYDEKQQELYFPLLLSPVEAWLMRRKTQDRMCSITTVTTADPKAKQKNTAYGFMRLQLTDMTWSIVPAKFPGRVVVELMARRASKLAAVHDRQMKNRKRKDLTNKRLPLLFSVAGVSRFQHKYAFAAIEPSAQSRQSSAKKLLVMHGGLGPEDYVMLLFTPLLKRRNIVQEGFVAFSESNEVSLSISRMGSMDQSSLTIEDDPSEFGSEFSRVGTESEQRQQAPVEVDANLLVGRPHRLASDPTLLPSMPTVSVKRNPNRFAVLYHNLSAVQSDKLLPEPTCPVAVLAEGVDVKAWSENFYAETRQWIAKNLKAARVEDKAARRGAKRQSRTSKSDENDEELTSDTDSEPSVAITDTKTVQREVDFEPSKLKDFFLEKNLEPFNLTSLEVRRNSLFGRSQLLSSEGGADSIRRLRMTVKRNEEVRRLPSTVFQRASLGNITDLGGAMAHALMEAALRRYEDDASLEARRHRALVRWRYLRAMVLNGEAAAIVHRANHEEARGLGIDISSSHNLALAPDLHTKGPLPRKVPARPIPYTVPTIHPHTLRSSEITPSGLVMYSGIKM